MLLGQIADSLIFTAAGMVGCWYGYQPIPAGPKHEDWVAWHARWGRFMRIGGPLLLAVGLIPILGLMVG